MLRNKKNNHEEILNYVELVNADAFVLKGSLTNIEEESSNPKPKRRNYVTKNNPNMKKFYARFQLIPNDITTTYLTHTNSRLLLIIRKYKTYQKAPLEQRLAVLKTQIEPNKPPSWMIPCLSPDFTHNTPLPQEAQFLSKDLAFSSVKIKKKIILAIESKT